MLWLLSESPDLSLLIQNKGSGSLNVNITAPDSVRLEQTMVQLQEKEDRKVFARICTLLFKRHSETHLAELSLSDAENWLRIIYFLQNGKFTLVDAFLYPHAHAHARSQNLHVPIFLSKEIENQGTWGIFNPRAHAHAPTLTFPDAHTMIINWSKNWKPWHMTWVILIPPAHAHAPTFNPPHNTHTMIINLTLSYSFY